MSRKRVAILISGRGSNMAALIAAAKASDYPAEITLVLSNVPTAAGLERAREARVLTVEHQVYPLALQLLAQGRVKIVDSHCIIDAAQAFDDRMIVPKV